MIRLFALILIWGLTGTSWAQSYEMKVNLINGAVFSFPVENIKKITFDGITEIKDQKKFQNIIKTFLLFQNYPNPFNPSTTIQYEISRAGNVEIKIFNVTGQLVKVLHSGQRKRVVIRSSGIVKMKDGNFDL